MVKPVRKLQMGKNGLSEAFIEQVKSILENERLVKRESFIIPKYF